MNTGADEDNLSTPILALSSARATPLAATTSNPANASRQNPFIGPPPVFSL
jgi:hypothetical protein